MKQSDNVITLVLPEVKTEPGIFPALIMSLFSHCTPAELDMIDQSGKLVECRADHYLYKQGQKAAGVFLILEGKIRISRLSTSGRECVVHLSKQGDVLGCEEAMTGQPFGLSAIALEPVKAYLIPLEPFRSITEKNAAVAIEIIRTFSQHLAETEEQLATLAFKPVRERVAHALLLLRKRFGQGQPDPFRITLSRKNLSHLVCTATETVFRVLAEFKEEGLIETRGSTIIILQPDKLLEIRDFYE